MRDIPQLDCDMMITVITDTRPCAQALSQIGPRKKDLVLELKKHHG